MVLEDNSYVRQVEISMVDNLLLGLACSSGKLSQILVPEYAGVEGNTKDLRSSFRGTRMG